MKVNHYTVFDNNNSKILRVNLSRKDHNWVAEFITLSDKGYNDDNNMSFKFESSQISFSNKLNEEQVISAVIQHLKEHLEFSNIRLEKSEPPYESSLDHIGL